MPRMDGTGPLGKGKLTGFGRGPCAQVFNEDNETFICPRCGLNLKSLYLDKDDKENLLIQKEILEKNLKLVEEKLNEYK